ncbi:MAG TPA: hypothetical protein PLU72_17085 [Candidatus Ozemobacteraceae bacterium]|nr:hypothetical protein [Candidatus Ozemobacteraceae bacterium]
MNRHFIIFLFLGLLVPAASAIGQTCRGFERSEAHRNDPAVKAVRTAIEHSDVTIANEFEFVRSIAGRFYVLTGPDFVFVDTAGTPDKHYVSPLFHVDGGKINVFWQLDRPQKRVFFISYEGKRNDGTQGRHVLYLEIPSTGNAWCNDVIGLEALDQADPSRTGIAGDRLRDVRLIDVNHDDYAEMLCSFDGSDVGNRKTLLFRQEITGNAFVFTPWKPTYSRAFFDTLFQRTGEIGKE